MSLFPLSPVSRIAIANIWIKVLILASPVTGIDIWDLAKNSLNPEIELSKFTGCFLTGTAAEVTPVSQIDKYKFTVCNVIKDLSESYQALVRKNTAS